MIRPHDDLAAAPDPSALADRLLTRPGGHRYFGRAVTAIRSRLALHRARQA